MDKRHRLAQEWVLRWMTARLRSSRDQEKSRKVQHQLGQDAREEQDHCQLVELKRGCCKGGERQSLAAVVAKRPTAGLRPSSCTLIGGFPVQTLRFDRQILHRHRMLSPVIVLVRIVERASLGWSQLLLPRVGRDILGCLGLLCQYCRLFESRK